MADPGFMAPYDESRGAEAGSEAIRGEVRLVGHRRVSHGLFLPHVAGLGHDEEFLRELSAWRLVLPDDAGFTHVTGARLLGWQLPHLPDPAHVPVFAAIAGDGPRPRRPGLLCSRLVRPARVATIDGVPVDMPEEILLRAARDFGILDLTILIDSAQHHGHIDPGRLRTVMESRRPGVRMLRLAWDWSDHRSESGPETVLRIFHRAIDVPVQPQAVLNDEAGNFVGRADLRIVGTNHLSEYDGGVHRGKARHRVDLRRERGMSATYTRHGYTLDDLLNHPITVMHEIDRMIERPHRIARIRRWQRLVDNSLYSVAGQERILNRWRRVGGITDWSRTA